MISDDDLTARIKRADRAQGIDVSEASLMGVLESARRAARGERRTRRIVAAVTGALVLAAAGVGVPATASVIERFSAQTGRMPSIEPIRDAEGSPPGTEAIPGSEWIDLSAPDLRAYVESIFPSSIPLAPGQTRAELIDSFISSSATGVGDPAVQQDIGMIFQFENAVYVGWISEWIDAYQANDSARQARASEVIAQAQNWQGYSVVYAGQGIRMMTDWSERLENGDYESAQALAEFEHADAWDGQERQPIIAQVVDAARE